MQQDQIHLHIAPHNTMDELKQKYTHNHHQNYKATLNYTPPITRNMQMALYYVMNKNEEKTKNSSNNYKTTAG